jgi:hypothetical protein
MRKTTLVKLIRIVGVISIVFALLSVFFVATSSEYMGFIMFLTTVILYLLFALGMFVLLQIIELLSTIAANSQKKNTDSILLSPGTYVVGVEILAGRYQISGTGDMSVLAAPGDSKPDIKKRLVPQYTLMDLHVGEKVVLDSTARFSILS